MAAPIVYPASAVALPPALTDAELADEFVAMVERDPKTLDKYRVHLEEFVAWLEEHGLSLLSARRPDIAGYLAYLKSDERSWRDSHKKPVCRPLGPSSRKGVLAALRAFYRHCAVMDYIAHDPTFGIETPKVEIKRGLSLTRAPAPTQWRTRQRLTATHRRSLRFFELVAVYRIFKGPPWQAQDGRSGPRR
jgi:site-specific recombinase XerD